MIPVMVSSVTKDKTNIDITKTSIVEYIGTITFEKNEGLDLK